MSDFADLVRETLRGSAGLPPGLDEQPLGRKVAALDQRMRTVSAITWGSVTFMAILGLIMFILLLTADQATETKTLVLYGAIFLWSALAIAMAKLWHFQMQSDTAAMKEILRAQSMLIAENS